ncbi:MAG: PTS sugar transporter subunit IIA [Deltaproteobacteria bacterium]|nr:PTS sugar transporter subunit IIA [Deltaproteobacteria bacterium]
MQIWKHLKTENIYLNVSLADKYAALCFIADTLKKNGFIKNTDILINGLIEREKTMSTGIGNGICFPHTTSPELTEAALMLIRPLEALDFEALDNLPVNIIMAIVVPENQTDLHLQMLAGMSRLCRDPDFLTIVRSAEDEQMLWQKIKELEEGMAFH